MRNLMKLARAGRHLSDESRYEKILIWLKHQSTRCDKVVIDSLSSGLREILESNHDRIRGLMYRFVGHLIKLGFMGYEPLFSLMTVQIDSPFAVLADYYDALADIATCRLDLLMDAHRMQIIFAHALTHHRVTCHHHVSL